MNWVQDRESECHFSPYGSFKRAFVIVKNKWWDQVAGKSIPFVDVHSDIFHTLIGYGDPMESIRGRGMPGFKSVEEAKAWCENYWYNHLCIWMKVATKPENEKDIEAVKKRVG
jgi:hypothetical protein